MDNKVGKYKIIQQLGKGATATVFLGEDEKEQKFALKFQQQWQPEEFESLKYFTSIKFTNIINHYEIFEFKQGIYSFLCQVIDYCNMNDLHDYLKQKRNQLTLEEKREIVFQIGFGLWELHQCKYIHRDIKPLNIMVDNQSGKPKFLICDLGLSKQFKGNTFDQTLNIGTPYYMAPELIDPANYCGKYNSAVDIWAFGVLIYDLFSEIPLFNAYTLPAIFELIKTKNVQLDLDNKIKDQQLNQLVYSLLKVDPIQRPTIDQILNQLNQERFQNMRDIFYQNNKQQQFEQNKVSCLISKEEFYSTIHWNKQENKAPESNILFQQDFSQKQSINKRDTQSFTQQQSQYQNNQYQQQVEVQQQQQDVLKAHYPSSTAQNSTQQQQSNQFQKGSSEIKQNFQQQHKHQNYNDINNQSYSQQYPEENFKQKNENNTPANQEMKQKMNFTQNEVQNDSKVDEGQNVSKGDEVPNYSKVNDRRIKNQVKLRGAVKDQIFIKQILDIIEQQDQTKEIKMKEVQQKFNQKLMDILNFENIAQNNIY